MGKVMVMILAASRQLSLSMGIFTDGQFAIGAHQRPSPIDLARSFCKGHCCCLVGRAGSHRECWCCARIERVAPHSCHVKGHVTVTGIVIADAFSAVADYCPILTTFCHELVHSRKTHSLSTLLLKPVDDAVLKGVSRGS